MFIGMYKSVNSHKEFYTEERNNLDFPTQVQRNSERFMLYKTVQLASKTQLANVIQVATNNGIEYNVKVD